MWYLWGLGVIKWPQTDKKWRKFAFFVFLAQNTIEAIYITLKTAKIVRLTRYCTYIHEISKFYIFGRGVRVKNGPKILKTQILTKNVPKCRYYPNNFHI